ncbi:MAG: SdpI family protein [Anaerolineales bacterium]|uniref:SdpI family protein n=1 Tax=Candidatus Villigracilis proximus TaxID=3140683 RepID=UPI003135D853|nr:SdpI family protein [Anaerolineales bacterium]
MSTKTTTIIALILISLALLAGAVLWNQLPDQMASHWNVNDEVDGTMPKFWGVFLMPLITLGMLALFIVLPGVDPLKANIAQFRESFNLFIVLIVAFMLYVHGLTLAWSLGFSNFKMSTAMLPFMGVLFIAIGFMLRKAKRNFFIGIRTPWTLSSDSVWDKTHQIGSILFMASGALAILGGFFGGMTAFWLMFVPLIGSSLFLVIYSYVLYRGETKS